MGQRQPSAKTAVVDGVTRTHAGGEVEAHVMLRPHEVGGDAVSRRIVLPSHEHGMVIGCRPAEP